MTDASSISQATLDSLWDFSDPAASAERFRGAADTESRPSVRVELATQRARALGLLGRFDEAEAVLDTALAMVGGPQGDTTDAASSEPASSESASGEPASVTPASGPAEPAQAGSGRHEQASAHPDATRERLLARIALERGRLRVNAERPAEGVPLFTLAARHAAAAGSQFLALDALHMLALADEGQEEEWAADGLDLLDTVTDDRTRRWGVALHNNLAWHLHDSGRPDQAITHFERALAAADAVGTADQRFIGRWALGRCLRTLGRTDEARAIQQVLAEERPDDEFVRAELAALSTPVEPD
ncbi:tetratricopeptide repeat protein [Glaciibacter sp. 2TAF33]|uniref:tetratricopeptide repeat protein n=1 Tax=Glaciibacter sp. 2TAF33 TaxID=3233015 RepID=UPI003F9382B3